MKLKEFIMVLLIISLLSLTTVSASEIVTANPGDYFAYYGRDTPAGQTHSFAIEVDSNVYYIDDYIAEDIASHSVTFYELYLHDLKKYEGMFRPDAISYGSTGWNIYYQLGHDEDNEMFTVYNDIPFSFEYESGQKVGYNNNAKVITKVYF